MWGVGGVGAPPGISASFVPLRGVAREGAGDVEEQAEKRWYVERANLMPNPPPTLHWQIPPPTAPPERWLRCDDTGCQLTKPLLPFRGPPWPISGPLFGGL